jgi:hypothetical protein
MDAKSSQATECNTTTLQQEKESLKVRQVVVRELEGLTFPALVLRMHDDAADIVYIDDAQVEYDVPVDELNATVEVQSSKAEIDEIWRKALDGIASSYSSDEEETTLAKCDQGGKYIAADGTLNFPWR